MTFFKLVNPCWVLSSLTYLVASMAIFIFFGYFGKSFMFAKQHDITRWEALGVSSFWSMDKAFFIFGTIFISIIVWVLYVLRFLWYILFNPDKRRAETKKDFLMKVLDLHDDELRKKKGARKKKTNLKSPV